jgi:hypothetical protein
VLKSAQSPYSLPFLLGKAACLLSCQSSSHCWAYSISSPLPYMILALHLHAGDVEHRSVPQASQVPAQFLLAFHCTTSPSLLAFSLFLPRWHVELSLSSNHRAGESIDIG